MTGSTAQQSLITATVDGVPLGVFDTLSGGVTSAEVSKRRAGGMGSQYSKVALPDNEDVTISRDYDRERDHELRRTLMRRTGRAMATISEQPLDDDGVPWGKPIVYTGRLSGVSPSEVDANSGDDRMLELTFVIEQVA